MCNSSKFHRVTLLPVMLHNYILNIEIQLFLKYNKYTHHFQIVLRRLLQTSCLQRQILIKLSSYCYYLKTEKKIDEVTSSGKKLIWCRMSLWNTKRNAMIKVWESLKFTQFGEGFWSWMFKWFQITILIHKKRLSFIKMS